MNKCRMLLLGSGLAWALAAPAFAGGEILTAVFSQTFNGYARTKLADGSCKPETFALGEGGHHSGLVRDDSIDRLPFGELAHVLAPYLARQNYVATPSLEKTDLMIVVHWGTTIPYNRGSYQTALDSLCDATASSGEGMTMGGDLISYFTMMNMENAMRDRSNALNGALLGYSSELDRVGFAYAPPGFGPRTSSCFSDLISDLEDERYYVVLAAFDFQLAWKKKQLKPLWITRVSIRTHRNRFDQQAETMIASASRYFGQDSRVLIRDLVPEGKVKIGEPKVLEVVPGGSR
jgi:hypothetical protein